MNKFFNSKTERLHVDILKQHWNCSVNCLFNKQEEGKAATRVAKWFLNTEGRPAYIFLNYFYDNDIIVFCMVGSDYVSRVCDALTLASEKRRRRAAENA